MALFKKCLFYCITITLIYCNIYLIIFSKIWYIILVREILYHKFYVGWFMKKIIYVCSIIAIIFVMVGCKGQKNSAIQNELKVDISAGKEISKHEDHGWMGDGETFIVFEFSGDDFKNELSQNKNWKKFPLDDITKTIMYGSNDTKIKYGPTFTDESGKTKFPEITDGYYMLLDRQDENMKKEGNILNRNSMNFTLGVYDSKENKLYYCKLDT